MQIRAWFILPEYNIIEAMVKSCAIGGYYLGSITGKLRYKYLERVVNKCYINVFAGIKVALDEDKKDMN